MTGGHADVDPARVGARLRALRRRAGLTQGELASRAGVSRQAVGALEAGRHLPRVDAAVALATALGTTVERLLTAEATGIVEVLGGALREGQPVRAARVGDEVVCVACPSGAEGEAWHAPDGVVRGDTVDLLADADLDAFVVAGCDPALGMLADLGPRGAGRLLPVPASTGAAEASLAGGRAHAAVAHDRAPAATETSGHRLRLASWRTGLAAPAGAEHALARALAGEGPVVQREPGATAQQAYERALDGRGAQRPPGPVAAGHLDAARRAASTGTVAVTIEPVARALGLAFRALEEHVVEIRVARGAVDHPGARALGEVVASARLRGRLRAFAGYEPSGP